MNAARQAAAPCAGCAVAPPRGTPPSAVPVPAAWVRLATNARLSLPGDADEVAADRAADALSRGERVADVGPALPGTVHRACTACEEQEERPARIQASGLDAPSPSSSPSPSFPSPLVPAGAGEALAPALRGVMEAGLGQSLARARLHRGEAAGHAARELGARAYTIGDDVVFGAGQYAPDTAAGRHLLAHELAHVLQGGAALRRSVAAGSGGGESEAVQGHTPHAPRVPSAPNGPDTPQRCAPPLDMACDEAHDSPADVSNELRFAQDSAVLSPLQISELDGAALAWAGLPQSVPLRIDGYASAEGECPYNWALSCRRAQAVAAELHAPTMYGDGVPSAQLRLVAHGESDERGRALAPNRRATVSMPVPEPDPSEEVSEAPPGSCGPESAQWLADQMNHNLDHPAIKTMREKQWPKYIPFFNLGWTYGFLSDFRELVRAGGPWDFKSNQAQWRFGVGKTCPTVDCDKTAQLCGDCYNYDVPGNIHYGFIGRAAGLRPWFLHNRADAAQAGGVDDPKDAVAVDIGIDLAEGSGTLCDALSARRSELNTDGSEACNACGKRT